MKKLMFALSIAAALAACKKDERTEEQRGKDEAAEALGIVRRLTFVRHPAAEHLCIGYVFVRHGAGNAAYGGPAMLEVDCDKVRHLIFAEEAAAP